ncbi:MAG: hypothetical protein OXF79_17285 [Chloroflexi bacterium]|nr:hypothetical protein [Chloroflexota bacterium]
MKVHCTIGLAALLSALMLVGCGGGGGGDTANTMQPPPADPAPMQPDDPPPPPPELPPERVERLPFPVAGFNCPDHHGEGTGCDAFSLDTFDPDNIPTYETDALPLRTRADEGRHQPVYHDHSQLFGIGVHDFDEHRRIFVGADRAPQSLPAAGTRGDTQLRHGTVADGVASADLRTYLTESLGTAATRFRAAPTVHIAGSPSAQEINWTVAAVELVNAALPADARMRVGEASDRTVTVEFRPYTEFAAGTGATTWNTLDGSEITGSLIHVSSDAFARGGNRHFVTLVAHELMHALGLGHVSPDFDTLMEETREIYRAWQGFGARGFRVDPDFSCGYRNCFTQLHENLADIPMPMSLLYPIDREALQVLYSKLDAGDGPTGYGYWANASLHIAGNGPHANFGVALRNGIAEPWAHGYLPERNLANNAALRGTAVWNGALVGLTPQAEAVAGDAAILVNLSAMTGRADFTNLESWVARSAPGAAGTGAMWLDGDLSYTIAVTGNTFKQIGGDAGILTGIFTGRSHEGVAGTLERPDLTAAFGAAR